jgi:hypothetical protein
MVSMRRDSIASDQEKEYIRRLTARRAVLLGKDRVKVEHQPVPNMVSCPNWDGIGSVGGSKNSGNLQILLRQNKSNIQ